MSGHPALLFVYGTLRSGMDNPYRRLLAERAECIGPARFRGLLYEVAGYPAMIPATDTEGWVRGELYRIDDHSLLPRLDEYEECSARFPAPHEYVRRCMPVMLHDGSSLDAWVYLYNREVAGLTRIPCGDYLAYLGLSRS